MTQPARSEQMTMRLTPDAPVAGVSVPGQLNIDSGRPKLEIVIPDDEGHVLLRLREEAGRLIIEGDEARWDEGAKRFLHAMMQWSGLVGIRWKDEVKRAVGE